MLSSIFCFVEIRISNSISKKYWTIEFILWNLFNVYAPAIRAWQHHTFFSALSSWAYCYASCWPHVEDGVIEQTKINKTMFVSSPIVCVIWSKWLCKTSFWWNDEKQYYCLHYKKMMKLLMKYSCFVQRFEWWLTLW